MGQSALYAKEAPIPQQTTFRGEKHQRKWYPTSCSTNLGHDNLTALADKPHKPAEMIWINVFQFSSKKQHKFRVTNIQNVKFNFFCGGGHVTNRSKALCPGRPTCSLQGNVTMTSEWGPPQSFSTIPISYHTQTAAFVLLLKQPYCGTARYYSQVPSITNRTHVPQLTSSITTN